jgi:hypothetical protein
MPIFSIPSPSKIYPDGDFWNETIPFGNPGGDSSDCLSVSQIASNDEK